MSSQAFNRITPGYTPDVVRQPAAILAPFETSESRMAYPIQLNDRQKMMKAPFLLRRSDSKARNMVVEAQAYGMTEYSCVATVKSSENCSERDHKKRLNLRGL